MRDVKEFMIELEMYDEIIVVFQGQVNHNYSHAACFVRSGDFKGVKQLTLLDCAKKGYLI